MWATCIVRFFRKKIVLGIIFVVSLTYCILSFALESGDNYDDNIIDTDHVKKIDPAFLWKPSPKTDNGTDLKLRCRNSIQGKVLIVDERGYVCSRSEILSSGCCDLSGDNIHQYSCETCNNIGCCSIFEYCISCCLHPDKKSLLENVLGKASDRFRVLFAAISDHFELCLAKCRTSSLSVQHENSYRDPKAKHCYGEYPPPSPLDSDLKPAI